MSIFHKIEFGVEKYNGIWYTTYTNLRKDLTVAYGIDTDILPPSDDRVFKLILTDPRAKPGLMKLISVVIGRNVVDVTQYPNEPTPRSTDEKAERLDINGKIYDGSQMNLEMQSSHMQEDSGGRHNNLKGKSVFYLTDLHSSQPSR